MSAGLPLALHAYRIGLTVLEPAASGLLLWRKRRGKEDQERLGERRGIASRERPEGRLAWLHGASIGETIGQARWICAVWMVSSAEASTSSRSTRTFSKSLDMR